MCSFIKLIFLQVRVDGFNYTGMGNSTSKKDAQTNAARDFVNYLVRTGEMKADEVPSLKASAHSFDQCFSYSPFHIRVCVDKE